MNRLTELNQISNSIEQAIWNEKREDSQAHIVDLANPENIIKMIAIIEEVVHEDFRSQSHYYIDKEEVQFEKALEQYEKMKAPYVFNLTEYNNLIKLPEHTQSLFFRNLLEIENKLETIEKNESNTSDLRFKLFKMENEKKKLYVDKEKLEKEYVEISEKKEQNNKEINEYIGKIKKSSKLLPINFINKVFNKKETSELNELYKSKAVMLEKENIDKTAEAFEKLLQKNDVNKKIKDIEKEVESLRNQYKSENNIDEKRTELLKEKNMLFKVFYIDIENDHTKEEEIKEIQEESEGG
jgi:hypothetical protein